MLYAKPELLCCLPPECGKIVGLAVSRGGEIVVATDVGGVYLLLSKEQEAVCVNPASNNT